MRGSLDSIADGLETLASPTYRNAIGDTARAIAYLSGIDGAVVMNRDLDVLAFGVKIMEKQSGKTEKVIKISPYENEDSSETTLTEAFRGKRHLSTARYVIDNPDSVAFTVSQDGSITGFIIGERSLCAYKGLELLL